MSKDSSAFLMMKEFYMDTDVGELRRFSSVEWDPEPGPACIVELP
jgi:hypothetical protein